MLNASAATHLDELSGKLPVLRIDGIRDAQRWVAENRDALRTTVTEEGFVMVRGLGLRDAAEAGAVFRLATAGLMIEREAFASRQTYSDGVYSSVKWPAHLPMCMHHELSYLLQPPSLMMFACLSAPTTGGATAVADSTTLLDVLPTDLVERFERTGWLLTRNYNDEIGASIAEAFSVADRADVERYCRTAAIEFDWQPDGGLRATQRRRAVVRHPVTGQRCWFNQVAAFNEWSLAPEVREYLIDIHGPDGLPFNTQFGNGDPIGADAVQLLTDAYEANTVREPWEAGDLLLVDNIRTAHCREPFTGPRDVVVAMGDPVRLTNTRPTTGKATIR